MDALKHGPLDPATPAQTLGGTGIPSARQPPLSPREPFSCSSTPQHDGERALRAAVLCSTAASSLHGAGDGGLSSRRGAGQASAPSAACPSLGSTAGTWWSCGGWEQWCLPRGLLRDATWSGCRSPGKMQLVSGGRQPSSPGGSQPGNHRGRDVHKAPRRAGASPRPSAIPESARSMGAFSPSFAVPSRRAPQPSQNPAFVRIF